MTPQRTRPKGEQTYREVVMLLRPHRPGEFWPWTLPAGTMVAVMLRRDGLHVRPIRMASNDNGETVAEAGDR